jgi:hypothetical protein
MLVRWFIACYFYLQLKKNCESHVCSFFDVIKKSFFSLKFFVSFSKVRMSKLSNLLLDSKYGLFWWLQLPLTIFFPLFRNASFRSISFKFKIVMQWNETKFYQMKAFLVKHHTSTVWLHYRNFDFQFAK